MTVCAGPKDKGGAMTCKVYKGGVLCGDFAPSDGRWHALGYVESTSHRCANCSYCAQFVLRRDEYKDLYLCRECREKVTDLEPVSRKKRGR